MEKKAFQAESQRLLDLMINSIYTHKEIFLRELLSNASDAVDKLAYKALTDDQVGLNRSEFKITLTPDQIARTLTVSDNGVGMTKEELKRTCWVPSPRAALSSSSRIWPLKMRARARAMWISSASSASGLFTPPSW